jgi:hypothetical protein
MGNECENGGRVGVWEVRLRVEVKRAEFRVSTKQNVYLWGGWMHGVYGLDGGNGCKGQNIC